MRENIIYILMAAGLLASCSDIAETGEAYLNGSSKTPIGIHTTLDASIQSRAYDKTFEADDNLLAYIEAGVTTDGIFSTGDNPFKGLKVLTLTADADNTDGDNHKGLYGYATLPDGLHITETDDDGLQKLYWDDYSSVDYDLRATGAGIRLKYGYCYNGGTPSTALIEATGVLGWTIGAQTTAEELKEKDLLFAKTQDMISYGHNPSDRQPLILPYSHAMSKITINVTADEGFSAENENFASSVLKLQHINTICSVNAPDGTVTSTTPAEITTYKSATENTTATFQAIIAPGTNLSAGNFLATITDVDGNKYNIPITAEMLTNWNAKLTVTDTKVSYGDVAQAKSRAGETIDQAKGYLTQPGAHYLLDVTVNKQKITVRATLADWDKVRAEASAQIIFTPDVVGKGDIATPLQQGGFDVYKSSTNDNFTTKSTTLTYGTDNKWKYTPNIYWAGQSDDSYFRAIAPAGNSSTELAQGTDVMWGTSGNVAIQPRTGNVPLEFEHIMSKLCIKLETASGANAVNLDGATIKITKMADTGTFSILDGTVSAGAVKDVMFSDKPKGFTEFVVPQDIADDAKVIITLNDGTTYIAQLNQCTTTNGSFVDSWLSGKHYTYTIYLEKEKITFRALIKDWNEATGSGNATLEWDDV